MNAPFEIIQSDAAVRAVPLSAVSLTPNQQRAIDDFHARTGNRWVIEYVAAGVDPLWMVSSSTDVIVNSTLDSTLQLAVRSQENW